MDHPEDLVLETISSASVDETLFAERVGGSKTDPDAVRRYLAMPIRWRPEMSVFFDREFYWQSYPDMSAVEVDPIIHFMRWGVGEKRRPHPLIAINYMLSVDVAVMADAPTIVELTAGQLDWQDRRDWLVADANDPAAFAHHPRRPRQSDGTDSTDPAPSVSPNPPLPKAAFWAISSGMTRPQA